MISQENNAFMVDRPEIEWFGEIRSRAGFDDFTDLMRDVCTIFAGRKVMINGDQEREEFYSFEGMDSKGNTILFDDDEWDEDRVHLFSFLELQERLFAIDTDER